MVTLLIALAAVLGVNEFLWSRCEFVWRTLLTLTHWPGEVVVLIGKGGLTVFVILAAVLAIRLLHGGSMRGAVRRLGFLTLDRRQLLAGGIIAGVLVALALAQWMILRCSATWGQLVLVQMATVGFAFVLHEEVVYRGFVFGELRRRTSFATAAVISSVLFALWHWEPALEAYRNGHHEVAVIQLSAPFLAGFALAWLFERGGGSLWGPIVAHFGQAVGQVFKVHFATSTPLWIGGNVWKVMPFIEIGVMTLIVLRFYPSASRAGSRRRSRG